MVVDACVSAAWFLRESGSPAAQALLGAERPQFHVAAIWPAEMCSIFAVNEWRGICNPAESDRWLELLRTMPITVDSDGLRLESAARILALARAHRVSAYDAQYLELALRLGQPLATFDRRLAVAARAAGVALAI